jgi:hypothetical protein
MVTAAGGPVVLPGVELREEEEREGGLPRLKKHRSQKHMAAATAAASPHQEGVRQAGGSVDSTGMTSDGALVEALTAAWKQSNQRRVESHPKLVPGAKGWTLYWIKRRKVGRKGGGGDNYLRTPRGNRLASITSARRWLEITGRMPQAQSAEGVKLGAIPELGLQAKGGQKGAHQTGAHQAGAHQAGGHQTGEHQTRCQRVTPITLSNRSN